MDTEPTPKLTEEQLLKQIEALKEQLNQVQAAKSGSEPATPSKRKRNDTRVLATNTPSPSEYSSRNIALLNIAHCYRVVYQRNVDLKAFPLYLPGSLKRMHPNLPSHHGPYYQSYRHRNHPTCFPILQRSNGPNSLSKNLFSDPPPSRRDQPNRQQLL